MTLFHIYRSNNLSQMPYYVSDMTMVHFDRAQKGAPGPASQDILLVNAQEASGTTMSFGNMESAQFSGSQLQLFKLYENLHVQKFSLSLLSMPHDDEPIPEDDRESQQEEQNEEPSIWTVPNDRVYLRLCGGHNSIQSPQETFESDFDNVIRDIRGIALETETKQPRDAGSL